MILKLVNKSDNPSPKYETDGSAGMDLRAFLEEEVVLESMERAMIPTGLWIEIPDGHEIQIRPRSGMAWKKGITLVNSPGTIDSDYRGELKILVLNLSGERQRIEPGERIAQMVMARVERIEWSPVDELEELQSSARGEGGFGSTGTN